MEEDKKYLERQDRYFNSLRDQYNTSEKYDAMADHKRIVYSTQSLTYAIRPMETISDYVNRLSLHIEIMQNTNTSIHVEAPKGCWYTHKSPTCFMCADRNCYTYLLNLLKTIAEIHPTTVPRQ